METIFLVGYSLILVGYSLISDLVQVKCQSQMLMPIPPTYFYLYIA